MLPQKMDQIRIFPNPCPIDHFSIQINGLDDNEPVNIEIYTISGQIVFTRKSVYSEGGLAGIPVSGEKNMNAGVYVISVHSRSGTINRKLILKD
jgi:hypothetical protein